MGMLGLAKISESTKKAAAEDVPEDPRTVTKKVFLDFALCPLNQNQIRSGSMNTVICDDPVPVGRLVIGLYGNTAPDSVNNFIKYVTAETGGYKGSTLQEIHRGEYFLGGRAGKINRGFVDPGLLTRNSDVTNPTALMLRHNKLGTVSLSIQPGELGGIGCGFTITTRSNNNELDDQSIVVGEVIEGMDILPQIDQIPTFRPSGTFTQLERSTNFIGGALGDTRAARARESWVKPKYSVLIKDAGVL